MDSKYAVLALTFLLTFSAISIAYSSPPTGTVLNPRQVDTHGPRISTVVFTVISSDSALESALVGGTIQAAEWTFTVASFNSMAGNPSVYENSTAGYFWYGIAFNALHGYMNNAHFRRAIAYLTDYSYIQTTVLSGVEGTATPYVMPCAEYGFMCGNEPAAYGYSTTQASAELIATHLHPDSGADPASANSSTTWCKVPVAGGLGPCPSGDAFSPVLVYRSDDPLRTGVAEGLAASAAEIGLSITLEKPVLCFGCGPEGPVISPGVYNSTTGYNSSPVFDGTVANSSSDAWDMNTYGWVTSDNYEAQAEFWNSAYVGSSINFGNFYNRTMDYDSNQVLYATTMSGAEAGAIRVGKVEMQQLPYVNAFFENTLFADYIAGWAGYANEPTTGPNSGGGLYYTLLNAHPTDSLTGGTLNLAIHQKADPSGIDPLYNTNWVWQTDLWSEFYDAPLVAPPTQFTTVNSFLNYMTTSYSVTPYTGKILSGSFYYQAKYETSSTGCGSKKASPCYYVPPKTITNGEVITLNFASNITWSDGVPFTAKDYQFSLYVWDLAIKQTTQADVATPDTGLMTGTTGLIASHVTVNSKVDNISIYINSLSVWNLANVIVPVMPQHVLEYFNSDRIATIQETLDTTLPYVSDVGNLTESSPANPTTHLGAITVPKAPLWMTYEPNMEVGSGPFTLTSYSETTGGGEMTANANYFRTAWWADINSTTNYVTAGSSYTHTYAIQEYIYNPASSTYCGVAPNTNGYCGITGHISGESSVKTSNVVTMEYCATAPVGQFGPTNCSQVDNLNGKSVTYSLVQQVSCSITPAPGKSCPKADITSYSSHYVVTIPTAASATIGALKAGYYEVVLTATFKFQGLARTWYQATGFEIS
jgi:hypothetical protein